MNEGGRKGQLFLTEEFQLTIAEEMRKRQNHHYNATEITLAGKILQQVPQLVGENLRRHRILVQSNSISLKIFINLKREKR